MKKCFLFLLIPFHLHSMTMVSSEEQEKKFQKDQCILAVRKKVDAMPLLPVPDWQVKKPVVLTTSEREKKVHQVLGGLFRLRNDEQWIKEHQKKHLAKSDIQEVLENEALDHYIDEATLFNQKTNGTLHSIIKRDYMQWLMELGVTYYDDRAVMTTIELLTADNQHERAISYIHRFAQQGDVNDVIAMYRKYPTLIAHDTKLTSGAREFLKSEKKEIPVQFQLYQQITNKKKKQKTKSDAQKKSADDFTKMHIACAQELFKQKEYDKAVQAALAAYCQGGRSNPEEIKKIHALIAEAQKHNAFAYDYAQIVLCNDAAQAAHMFLLAEKKRWDAYDADHENALKKDAPLCRMQAKEKIDQIACDTIPATRWAHVAYLYFDHLLDGSSTLYQATTQALELHQKSNYPPKKTITFSEIANLYGALCAERKEIRKAHYWFDCAIECHDISAYFNKADLLLDEYKTQKNVGIDRVIDLLEKGSRIFTPESKNWCAVSLHDLLQTDKDLYISPQARKRIRTILLSLPPKEKNNYFDQQQVRYTPQETLSHYAQAVRHFDADQLDAMKDALTKGCENFDGFALLFLRDFTDNIKEKKKITKQLYAMQNRHESFQKIKIYIPKNMDEMFSGTTSDVYFLGGYGIQHAFDEFASEPILKKIDDLEKKIGAGHMQDAKEALYEERTLYHLAQHAMSQNNYALLARSMYWAINRFLVEAFEPGFTREKLMHIVYPFNMTICLINKMKTSHSLLSGNHQSDFMPMIKRTFPLTALRELILSDVFARYNQHDDLIAQISYCYCMINNSTEDTLNSSKNNLVNADCNLLAWAAQHLDL